MHLKPHAFGLSGAVVMAIGYVLCAAYYVLAPDSWMAVMNFTNFNFDLSPIKGTGLTWGSFFGGLVSWFVLAYVFTALFAWLYNKMSK